MPQLSAFTPCGCLELSSRKSFGEEIYRALVSDLEKSFDMTQGTYVEAWAYATAMMLGRAKYAVLRAGNQGQGDTAYDLLPVLEQAYLLVAKPNDSVAARQNAVALAQAPLRGARLESVVDGLRQRIGSALLSVSTIPSLQQGGMPYGPISVPNSPGAGPGNWVDPRTPTLFLRLVDPVSILNTPLWVAYESLDTTNLVTNTWAASTAYPSGVNVVPTTVHWTGFYYSSSGGTTGATEPTWPTAIGGTVADGTCTWTCIATSSPTLHIGQTITVQGEDTSSSERVTVTGVSNTPPAGSFAGTGLCFQATFTLPHDTGASLITGAFPYWWSTQRMLLVVVAAALAGDAPTRALIDAWMSRATRGVDQWATVQPSSVTAMGGTIGPLQVGSPMGCVPVGTFTFTNTT